jgi:hypothetical protein
LPVPVILKRFLAPDLVFSLGILLSQILAANRIGRPCGLLRKTSEMTRHGSPLLAGRVERALLRESAAIGKGGAKTARASNSG